MLVIRLLGILKQLYNKIYVSNQYKYLNTLIGINILLVLRLIHLIIKIYIGLNLFIPTPNRERE
jgi:hypothetical protein